MHLIVTIDLGGDAFRDGNVGSETARILHGSAERLAALHTHHGALSYENPEQLYLLDNTGAMVGYVSTVEIDDITPAAQDRIAEYTAVAADSTIPSTARPRAPRDRSAKHARRRRSTAGVGTRDTPVRAPSNDQQV